MTEHTVIRAAAMLTPAGVLTDAEIAWDADGRITYAGPARTDSVPDRVLAEQLLMPGLTNGHTHSAMTLMRGISDDDGFMPWLDAVQAAEQQLTPEDIAAGLDLALIEMIETGTTAFADLYTWDAALIERVRASGMRVFASLAATAFDQAPFPNVSQQTGREILADTVALAEQYGADPQVRIGFGPHAPYSCTPEFLREVRDLAVQHGVPVHTHIAESVAEVETIRAEYDATPVEFLAGLGFFDADVHAAHCVQLAAGEPAVLAAAGVSVSHNPVSNLKLGCGIAPFAELIAAGVQLALGTDSVASNNSLDLFEEIKLAALLPRREPGHTVTAAQALHAATAGGSAAIGFPDAGALEAGKYADLIAIDLGATAAAPISASGATAFLGYGATGADVREVWVAGRHLYTNGKHLTLNKREVLERARAARERLIG